MLTWTGFMLGFCALLLLFAAISDFYYHCRARALMNAIRRGDKCRVIGSTVGTYRIRNGLRSWMLLRLMMRSVGHRLNDWAWSKLFRETGQPAPGKWESHPPIRYPAGWDLRTQDARDDEWDELYALRVRLNSKEIVRQSEKRFL